MGKKIQARCEWDFLDSNSSVATDESKGECKGLRENVRGLRRV